MINKNKKKRKFLGGESLENKFGYMDNLSYICSTNMKIQTYMLYIDSISARGNEKIGSGGLFLCGGGKY